MTKHNLLQSLQNAPIFSFSQKKRKKNPKKFCISNKTRIFAPHLKADAVKNNSVW